jgi:metal-responsive CopG/Arc/MetJ family transcriptional regulator
MGRSKVAVSLDADALDRLDRLVRAGAYPSRSRAIEAAIQEKLERLGRTRLAKESAKLDPEFEKALAEEGMSAELGSWPEY